MTNHLGQEIEVSQVLIAHKDPEGDLRYFSSIMRDMTERRHSDQALRDSQQRLVETSRLAGMAEVATGVLHNVGNVLNSVNVSAGLVVEKLRRSKADKVGKAAALLTGRNGDLGDYLHNDETGKKLPGYLAQLGEFLVTENKEILQEVDQLGRNIEHIKEVVAMQQSYAKVSGALEDLPVAPTGGRRHRDEHRRVRTPRRRRPETLSPKFPSSGWTGTRFCRSSSTSSATPSTRSTTSSGSTNESRFPLPRPTMNRSA